MKKALMLVVAAVAGYAVWLKVQQDREERDLWAEVTDSFEEYPGMDSPEESVSAAPPVVGDKASAGPPIVEEQGE